MYGVQYSLVPTVLAKMADLGRYLREALAEAARRRVELFYDGWKPKAVFLRFPLTKISAWVEWSETSVGGYAASSQSDREVYLGRIRGILSVG